MPPNRLLKTGFVKQLLFDVNKEIPSTVKDMKNILSGIHTGNLGVS